jgi:hypothetical protein
MAAYARQAKDQDQIAWATGIKIRAEHKCGEMLRAAAQNGERSTGGRPWPHASSVTGPSPGRGVPDRGMRPADPRRARPGRKPLAMRSPIAAGCFWRCAPQNGP